MKKPTLCAVSVLLLWLGGCAHGPSGTNCTLPGNATWTEYRSKHFVFDVWRSERDAQKLVSSFEELLGAVSAALVVEPIELPGQLRVVRGERWKDWSVRTCSVSIG